MARTKRTPNPRPYNKESKEYRKRHYKRWRIKAKVALEQGKEVDNPTRTSGWLTH